MNTAARNFVLYKFTSYVLMLREYVPEGKGPLGRPSGR